MQNLHTQIDIDQLAGLKIRLSTTNVAAIIGEAKSCHDCSYLCELIDEDDQGYFIYAGDITSEEIRAHVKHSGVVHV